MAEVGLRDLGPTARRLGERLAMGPWGVAMLEPGFAAIAHHRHAKAWWDMGLKGIAMALASWGRAHTGVWIHPNAHLGRSPLLLNPAGISIAASAHLGDEVVLESGCRLVGVDPLAHRAADPILAYGSGRRHPHLGDRVHVEAGVIVLGDVFVGDGARLRAGAVVDRDVPPGGEALGPPSRILPRRKGAKAQPDAQAIVALAERLGALEERLQVLAFQLKRQLGERNAAAPEAYGSLAEVEALLEAAGL